MIPNEEKGQFKPGQSGNPAGKPKGTKHLSTILKAMLNEEVEIDGKMIKFDQALIKRLLKKATEGDIKAIQEVFDRTEGKAKQEIDQTVTGSWDVTLNINGGENKVRQTLDAGLPDENN